MDERINLDRRARAATAAPPDIVQRVETELAAWTPPQLTPRKRKRAANWLRAVEAREGLAPGALGLPLIVNTEPIEPELHLVGALHALMLCLVAEARMRPGTLAEQAADAHMVLEVHRRVLDCRAAGLILALDPAHDDGLEEPWYRLITRALGEIETKVPALAAPTLDLKAGGPLQEAVLDVLAAEDGSVPLSAPAIAGKNPCKGKDPASINRALKCLRKNGWADVLESTDAGHRLLPSKRHLLPERWRSGRSDM